MADRFSQSRRRRHAPVGVLLAGGDGRRLGGDKARTQLAGRPLAHYALEALCEALDDVVVACRLDTELPALPGVREAWVESGGARGPLAGIVSALRESEGRAIVACAVSLPLVTADMLRALAGPPAAGALVTIPSAGGRLHPLVGRWEPAALELLSDLPLDSDLDAAVLGLRPASIAMEAHADSLLRVEAPEDLLLAGAALDARRRRARSLV